MEGESGGELNGSSNNEKGNGWKMDDEGAFIPRYLSVRPFPPIYFILLSPCRYSAYNPRCLATLIEYDDSRAN